MTIVNFESAGFCLGFCGKVCNRIVQIKNRRLFTSSMLPSKLEFLERDMLFLFLAMFRGRVQ